MFVITWDGSEVFKAGPRPYDPLRPAQLRACEIWKVRKIDLVFLREHQKTCFILLVFLLSVAAYSTDRSFATSK